MKYIQNILIYAYILRLCHDPSLAEEVTQEAFFKALKHIDAFRGECRLNVWLCQIARNRLYSVLKKQSKQAACVLERLESDMNVEEIVENKDTAHHLHQILHRLDEPYKEVFCLRTFAELSFAEIGALFEKTESWARRFL